MEVHRVENELKALILDEDFNSLQGLVNREVNLMDILRVSHKELQHSNFLAWLFNPNETHNLGDFALKELIRVYYKGNEFRDLGNEAGLSVFDFVMFEFDDLEIKREYKNIDLLILSKKNQIGIVIENKIRASERDGQLKKYRKIFENEYANFKHKIFIYLSLTDQDISDEEQEYYIQLNYGHIKLVIEQILLNQRYSLADETRFVFEQYLQTLNSIMNKNEEIEKIAKQLYRKYKSAFDLVYKYSTRIDTSEIWEKLNSMIQNEKSIIQINSDNKFLRFHPKVLYDNIDKLQNQGLLYHGEDLTKNWIFLYEFNFQNDRINFDCKIGAGNNQEAREKLYETYRNSPNIFNKMGNRKLVKGYHTAYQKQFLSPKDIDDFMENGYSEEFELKLSKKFRQLMDKELPRLTEWLQTLS